MKSRLFMFCAAILVAGWAASTVAIGQTTFYVVRHAEKIISKTDRNPALSEAGKERAEALSRALRSIKVDACLSTKYKRTTDTLTPTAKRFGLKVQSYQAGRESSLAPQWLKEHQGKTLVISGHSNTVPKILSSLGVKEKLVLDEHAYDNLFMVKISKDGKVSFTHLHYGKANPK